MTTTAKTTEPTNRWVSIDGEEYETDEAQTLLSLKAIEPCPHGECPHQYHKLGAYVDADLIVLLERQRAKTPGELAFDAETSPLTNPGSRKWEDLSNDQRLIWETHAENKAAGTRQPAAPAIQPPEQAERLLEAAAQAQVKFWDVLRELEAVTGLDIESTRDLEGLTVKDLREEEA